MPFDCVQTLPKNVCFVWYFASFVFVEPLSIHTCFMSSWVWLSTAPIIDILGLGWCILGWEAALLWLLEAAFAPILPILDLVGLHLLLFWAPLGPSGLNKRISSRGNNDGLDQDLPRRFRGHIIPYELTDEGISANGPDYWKSLLFYILNQQKKFRADLFEISLLWHEIAERLRI